jgi:hypothetical protein
MKVTRFLVALSAVAAFATSASAQGVASLNWDTCAGPIAKAIAPGTVASLYASVTNHSAPHNAYQVFVALGSGSAGPIADAWRFDAAGCQGSSFITIDHIAPAAVIKVCPSFQPPVQSLPVKDYSFDPISGKARAVCSNAYPAGDLDGTNPATRYFLARFLFDHTFSVVGPTTPGADCGGLEKPVCAHFTSASWLNIGGSVETEWAKNSEFVTANDPNNDTRCPGATPAQPTTWGSIKAQYKH